MRSLLYTANPGDVSGITTGSVLPIGNLIRKAGRDIDLNGSSIMLGDGVYQAIATFSVTPSASDTITIKAYLDGVEIPGAEAAFTAATETTMPLVFIVKQPCCRAVGVLSFGITMATSTTTATLNNAAVSIIMV